MVYKLQAIDWSLYTYGGEGVINHTKITAKVLHIGQIAISFSKTPHLDSYWI